MSLTDCVQEALQRNLDLQVERYNPQIANYNLRGAYAGWDPTFNISGQHNFNLSGGGFSPIIGTNTPPRSTDENAFSSGIGGVAPWGLTYNLFGNISEIYGRQLSPFDTTSGQVGINLTQPLLKNFWIDSTRLNIAVSKNRLKYSELELRGKIMDVITSVEKSYYDLIAAKENVKVQQKALQLAQQLLSENKKRVEVGTLAPLDEKQAASQVAARQADLVSAEKGVAIAENALRGLLNAPYNETIEPVEQLNTPAQSFSVLESLQKGMTLRPDLLQAKLDVERQGIQLKYDRNQLFPQLDLVGSYGHTAGGAGVVEFSDGFDEFQKGNHPFYSYGAKLSIPLSNRGARSNYRISKLVNEQTITMLKRLENAVVTEIDNSVITARASFESLDSRREARLYAEAALEAEQKKLESGKSTSFVVLQLQRDLTSARADEITALADYNKALADLARSEGSTLERRSINLQVK